MNILNQMGQAVIGWGEIITGRETARQRFGRDADAGLVALLAYCLVMGLVIGLQVSQFGVPQPIALVAGILVNMLPVVALSLVTVPTYLALKRGTSPFEMLVPGIYLLALTLLVGIPLTYIDAQVSVALIGVTGFLLFRAARIVGGLGVGTALAYAILTCLVLVALPSTLYMVLASAASSPI